MFYRIVNWDELYENHRTRGLQKLEWVPIPNKMDGSGYAELFARRNGATHFGVWIALLQVASKCSPRGTLLKSTGQPHDLRSLSLITRIPPRMIRSAIDRLLELRWLEQIEMSAEATNLQPQRLDNASTTSPQRLDYVTTASRPVQTVAEYKRDKTVSAPDLRDCTRTRAPALPFRSVLHTRSVEKTTNNPEEPGDWFSEFWARFWDRWAAGTRSSVGEMQACRAAASVVREPDGPAVMECLESYIASEHVANGKISDCARWVFAEAENRWRSRWPPPRAAPAREQHEYSPAVRGALEMARKAAANGNTN